MGEVARDGGKQLSFASGTVNVKLDPTRADVRALAKTKSGDAYAGYLLKWGTAAGTLATRNTGTTFVLDADSAVKYKLRDGRMVHLLSPTPDPERGAQSSRRLHRPHGIRRERRHPARRHGGMTRGKGRSAWM